MRQGLICRCDYGSGCELPGRRGHLTDDRLDLDHGRARVAEIGGKLPARRARKMTTSVRAYCLDPAMRLARSRW